MRPILCTHEFAPFRGGVGVAVQEIAGAGARLGYEPLVLAPDYGGAGAGLSFPFPIHRWRGGGRLSPVGLWETARALIRQRKANPDARIWLASYGAMEAALWAGLAGWRPGSLGLLLVGSELLKFEQRPWLGHWARRMFAQTERVAVISEFVRHQLRRSPLAALDDRTQVIPMAIRTDLPEPIPRERQAGEPFVILTLARIHPRKGQLEMARALATLPASVKQRLLYRVAGKGDAAYLRQVEGCCRSYGVPYEFVGPVADADLAQAYGACDLYAMASVTLPGSVEGFGMTLLEAGFYGKPVVAWRSGGIPEAVVEGVTGQLVEEHDVDGLGRVIAAFMDDPARCRAMGEAGARHARSLGWEAAAAILFG